MVKNRENFEPFIEDDQKFDDYIKDLTKDGEWGGNLEIQALAMRFNINFFIHIYNHPLYIVKNFSQPLKNIHLSYHDGNHYNSVRLLNDVAEDIPPEISEDIIKGIQQTTDSTALNENEENGNDEEDNKKRRSP